MEPVTTVTCIRKFLPPIAVATLAAHTRRVDDGSYFRGKQSCLHGGCGCAIRGFHKRGRISYLLLEVDSVQEPQFAASVGIDWADRMHVWCLQSAPSEQRERGELEHSPETVEAWAGQLCQRFANRPIAVAVE